MSNSSPCADFISNTTCPLSRRTACSRRGSRIRVLQHLTSEIHISTDWIASQKQDNSVQSLLNLPREIRDAIYDFALPTNEHFSLGFLHLHFPSRTSHYHCTRACQPRSTEWVSLFCASKQLHHEAAARFYLNNAFSVTCSASSKSFRRAGFVATFGGFAGLVPRHRAYMGLMPAIEVVVHDWEWSQPPELARLRVGNPTWKDGSRATLASNGVSVEQIEEFVSTTQEVIDMMTTCRCLRLIHLGGGTYTLRRPPGPGRDKCKAKTWKGMNKQIADNLKNPQPVALRIGGMPRRRKKFTNLECCLIILFAIAYLSTCYFCGWDNKAFVRARKRWKNGWKKGWEKGWSSRKWWRWDRPRRLVRRQAATGSGEV